MKDIILNAKKHNVQFIFMETSERPDLNQALESLHAEFKDVDNINFVGSYDEALSHLLFAGPDIILCQCFHDPTDETPLKSFKVWSSSNSSWL
jgi:glycogen synthase